MTKDSMPLIELSRKQDDGDSLRAVAEAVLQLMMEADVEGMRIEVDGAGFVLTLVKCSGLRRTIFETV